MTAKTNTAPLRFIDANILFINPENPRKDLGDLSELEASIKANGILQPLLVRPVDGAYMVIDGSCRLAAGLQAGLSSFPCHVTEVSDEKALEMAVTANIVRKEMTVLDEIRAVGKLASTGEIHAEIAARFGRSPSWVSTRAKIAQMPESVLELIGAGKLGIAAAEELCRLGNAETIVELAENAANLGYGIPQMRSQIDSKLRRLADAPWVTGRSECARCIQRSDKQVNLFEKGGPARCMDSLCWEAKKEAWIKAKGEELRKQGYLPKQEYVSEWAFVNHCGQILNPKRIDDQAQIEEMQALGIKPRFMIEDEPPYDVIFRYDVYDMPEKTEKTASSDDVPEEVEEATEEDYAKINATSEEDSEGEDGGEGEEESEEPEAVSEVIPAWKRRKEAADRMREVAAELRADDIRDAALLRFVAEAYRASTSGVNRLDALNDGKCILACNIDDIKRALLVDIVGEFCASKDFGDDDEAVGYWEQFKDAFGFVEDVGYEVVK